MLRCFRDGGGAALCLHGDPLEPALLLPFYPDVLRVYFVDAHVGRSANQPARPCFTLPRPRLCQLRPLGCSRGRTQPAVLPRALAFTNNAAFI